MKELLIYLKLVVITVLIVRKIILHLVIKALTKYRNINYIGLLYKWVYIFYLKMKNLININ